MKRKYLPLYLDVENWDGYFGYPCYGSLSLIGHFSLWFSKLEVGQSRELVYISVMTDLVVFVKKKKRCVLLTMRLLTVKKYSSPSNIHLWNDVLEQDMLYRLYYRVSMSSKEYTFVYSISVWLAYSSKVNSGQFCCRIDENMDDTLANVEGAQGALLKYLNSISSNRWLMIKIFFVLIFFLMVFLFFVA